jgi:hypothetical protein
MTSLNGVQGHQNVAFNHTPTRFVKSSSKPSGPGALFNVHVHGFDGSSDFLFREWDIKRGQVMMLNAQFL